MAELDDQRIHNAKWVWRRGIGFDREANWLYVNGRIIQFGATECDILQVIMEEGRATTGTIARRVYGARDDVEDENNAITVAIRHIRVTLGDTSLKLVNLRGVGRGLEGLYTLEWD